MEVEIVKDVMTAFDEYLAENGLSFNATVIGGAALIAMGVIARATQDLDCLDPSIPEAVKRASREFAKSYSGPAAPLKEDWLNDGPASLKDDLPKGWRDRTVPLFEGKAFVLRTLGRMELLCTKLFAYCDRQQDLQDCEALKPTRAELAECLPWVIERDAHPQWPDHVKTSLKALAERLGYAFEP